MPPFSPCGLAVEWVRSSHSGYWRFYPTNPAMLTPGEFYFVPDDTPHLKCPHPFGSADWSQGDTISLTQVGEVANISRKWERGTNVARIPPPVAVGACADFSDDWTNPYPPNGAKNLCGIDSRCYTNVQEPFVDADCLCELQSITIQAVYAKLIELTYAKDFVTMSEFFLSWMGPDVFIYTYPVLGNIPAMVIVTSQLFTFVVISGTTNFQQLALQGFYGLRAPQQIAGYGTEQLWFDTSVVVAKRFIEVGIDASAPLVLTGHSYGGAVACNVAVRARLASLVRDICVLTYGCPMPGDAKMQSILRLCNVIQLANDDDIVTVVPPTRVELAPFLPIIGRVLLDRWSDWRPGSDYVVQSPDGEQNFAGVFDVPPAVLPQIIANAIAGIPLARINGHGIDEYLRRILLNPLDPRCCVDQSSFNIIFPVPPQGPGGIVLGGQADYPGPPKGGLAFAGAGRVVDHLFGDLRLGGFSRYFPAGEGGIILGGAGIVEAPAGSGGIVLSGPLITRIAGEGGIELGGDGDLPYDVTGGIVLNASGGTSGGSPTSCAAALDQGSTDPTTVIGTVTGASPYWYVWHMPYVDSWHCNLTSYDSNFGSALVYSGPDCAHLTLRGTLTAFSDTVFFDDSVEENIYLVVQNNLFGPTTFHILIVGD